MTLQVLRGFYSFYHSYLSFYTRKHYTIFTSYKFDIRKSTKNLRFGRQIMSYEMVKTRDSEAKITTHRFDTESKRHDRFRCPSFVVRCLWPNTVRIDLTSVKRFFYF